MNTAITLLAADLSLEHDLSFAGSIIYANAQQNSIELITSASILKD